MNFLKPKISRPAPLPEPDPVPAPTTTSQLAPKPASSTSSTPLPKQSTRKFRIDIGDTTGYGSGLNIPT